MEKYRVWLKGWVEVEAENDDDAISQAFDDLGEMTVTKYSSELVEGE